LRFDANLVLWARLSEFGGARIYVYGTTEYFSTSLFKLLLTPGATVIDVGANLGQYTLLAAKYSGPTGTVLAFEPRPEIFTLLAKSIEENGFANVILSDQALSDRDGSAKLYLPGGSNFGAASLLPVTEPKDSIRVECARLDTVLDAAQIGHVDLVKVDVEGHEPEVFEGASRTLERDKPIVLFEVNALRRSPDGVSAQSVDELRQVGYEMYGVEELGGRRWRLINAWAGDDLSRFRDRWETDDFPPNLLAVHPENPDATRTLERIYAASAHPTRDLSEVG
jgi:FkbM family methyltransferase